jgi:hypothetical protein
MFDSGILDVAIGLAFVFLLFSLLVSAASELLAAAFKWRAAFLWRGIENLLQDQAARDKLYEHPLIRGLADVVVPPAAAGPGVVDWQQGRRGPSYIPSRTFALALIYTLREPHAAVDNAIGRLQRVTEQFAADPAAMVAEIGRTVDDIIANTQNQALKDKLQRLKSTTDPQQLAFLVRTLAAEQADAWISGAAPSLQGALRPLLDEAANDIDRFRENIEIWFNDGMNRVSGWYKRYTSWVHLGIALVLSVLLNVDALNITRTLWREPTLRAAIVNEASDFEQSPSLSVVPPAPLPANATPATLSVNFVAPPPADQRFLAVRDQLTTLGLPMGWRVCTSSALVDQRDLPFWCHYEWNRDAWADRTPNMTQYVIRAQDLLGFVVQPFVRLDGWMMIVGWLLTTAAASLGAPFWFDLLKRFISVRSSGKAPEEKPLAPKQVPQPTEPGQSPREADLLGARRRAR